MERYRPEKKPLRANNGEEDGSNLKNLRRYWLRNNETPSGENKEGSLKRKAEDNVDDVDDAIGFSQFKKLRKVASGLGYNKESTVSSKSKIELNDQEKENDVPARADTTAKRKQRTPFASKENLQQQRDTEQHGASHSREIGPNRQGDAAQQSKEIGQITEELKRTPELRDKFDNLYTQILDIDPKVQGDATQLSKEIERIRENLEITPEEFQKFNRLLDAIPSDEQGDQTNGGSPEVKDTRNSQKNEVNGEKPSNEIQKVTQADIDKLARKIESSKHNWDMFMELMMAMQTPGNGY